MTQAEFLALQRTVRAIDPDEKVVLRARLCPHCGEFSPLEGYDTVTVGSEVITHDERWVCPNHGEFTAEVSWGLTSMCITMHFSDPDVDSVEVLG